MEPPCCRYTLGMRDLDDVAGALTAAGVDETEVSAARGRLALGTALPEAATIAFISFSVTPALCRVIRPVVEVSNFPGCDWIAPTMIDSGSLLLTMLITSAFVSGRSFCCANRKGHSSSDSPRNMATLKFRGLIRLNSFQSSLRNWLIG